MSNLPAELRYAASHEWARLEADGSVTVVDGRLRDVFGEAYQGQRSAWEALPAGATATYQLASSSGFATTATWPGSN